MREVEREGKGGSSGRLSRCDPSVGREGSWSFGVVSLKDEGEGGNCLEEWRSRNLGTGEDEGWSRTRRWVRRDRTPVGEKREGGRA